MIYRHQLSAKETAALKENDQVQLAYLHKRIRTLVLQNSNMNVVAWQILGLPINVARMGPTPVSSRTVISEEAASVATMTERVACCLGNCVTFPGMKQEDKIVQQVFPVPGFEDRQSAASSRSALTWHTEHADKDHPPDFLVITCLRNHDGIGTRLSRPDLCQLDSRVLTILSTPTEFQFATRATSSGVLAVIDHEGLRYDPVYCTPLSRGSRKAFQQLAEQIENTSFIAPQIPGVALIIPNRRTVHARDSFQTRYDGTDRWLMRAMVRRTMAAL